MTERAQTRRMTSEDIETVAELFAEANPHAKTGEIADWTRRYLAEYPELLQVIEEAGEVVGAVSCGFTDEKGYVGDIAVRADMRRKGYGTVLMNKALDAFRKKGTRLVNLGVHWKCAQAIPFYYTLGFRIKSVKADGYGKGHDYVEMETNLG